MYLLMIACFGIDISVVYIYFFFFCSNPVFVLVALMRMSADFAMTSCQVLLRRTIPFGTILVLIERLKFRDP